MATQKLKVRIRGELTLEIDEEEIVDRDAPAADGWPAHPEEFGKAVRSARVSLQLTRAAFAKKVGAADSTIRNVEMARHQCAPTMRTFIVKALTKLGQKPPPPRPARRVP